MPRMRSKGTTDRTCRISDQRRSVTEAQSLATSFDLRGAQRHPNGAKMSDGQIAEHVGVSVAMVGKYRAELTPTIKDLESTTRTGRDGRKINTANIGRRQDADSYDQDAADVDSATAPVAASTWSARPACQ